MSEHALIIRNYAFGCDGMSPKHEVDLRVHYAVDQDGGATVVRIEADNGKSTPYFARVFLPDCVIEELQRECELEYAEANAAGEEE